MRLSNLLIIGGIGYLAYRAWTKAAAAQGLMVSVKKIKWAGTDLGKTQFDLDLSIINPSSESFSFTRFFGQLRFNGEVLVNVMKEGAGSGITIQPAGETVISLPVYINHLSAATTVFTIISKIVDGQPVDGLQFNGILYAGGLQVPITQTINLPSRITPVPGITGNRGAGCLTCRSSLNGVLN